LIEFLFLWQEGLQLMDQWFCLVHCNAHARVPSIVCCNKVNPVCGKQIGFSDCG